MGIKKDLIEGIKKIFRLKSEEDLINKNISLKLGDKRKDVTEVAKFLIKNPEINTKKNNLEEEQQGILFEIVFSIIEGIPKAENEFYSTIADIKGVDVNAIKDLDGAETVGFLKEIVSSETFKGFFSLTMK